MLAWSSKGKEKLDKCLTTTSADQKVSPRYYKQSDQAEHLIRRWQVEDFLLLNPDPKPVIYTTSDSKTLVEDEFLNFLVVKNEDIKP